MPGPQELLTVVAGLAFGLSLIVAIGAQNTFVLRQGLLGQHVLLVVAVCALSDVVLIVAGVAGTGALISRLPGLETVMRVGGALFLLGYATLAARRAIRPAALRTEGDAATTTRLATLGTVLAFTWLNPHVYLDTLVLLGSVADSHHDRRWWFAVGAGAGSVIWFTTVGYGAALLRPVFARPAAWRVLDATIAVIMTLLAVSLLSTVR